MQLPGWYSEWQHELLARGPGMSDSQAEACARLATVLLCGEQSAIHIFAAEVARSREQGASNAWRDLVNIELDEYLHEQALSSFCDYLPQTDDQHRLKRRAQRFFAGLGRVDSLSLHFAQISQLDAAVCKIMYHVEHSDIDAVSPLRLLAGKIKLDEARHVAVSRRYAADMGYSIRAEREDAERVRGQLVEMLQPLGDAFETVGVDSDRLFAHINSNQ